MCTVFRAKALFTQNEHREKKKKRKTLNGTGFTHLLHIHKLANVGQLVKMHDFFAKEIFSLVPPNSFVMFATLDTKNDNLKNRRLLYVHVVRWVSCVEGPTNRATQHIIDQGGGKSDNGSLSRGGLRGGLPPR